MNNVCQDEDEDASTFLLRALELRQKVIVASSAEGVVKYSRELIQEIFMHILKTGFRDESIRAHMKPYLTASAKNDDTTLIREVNIASSESTERLRKQKGEDKRKTKASVNSVEVTNSGLETMLSPLIKSIADLQKELSSLKANMNNTNKCKKEGVQNGSWKKKGCQACLQADKYCNHCWKCGEKGHMSRNCQPSSNGKGLHQGGK